MALLKDEPRVPLVHEARKMERNQLTVYLAISFYKTVDAQNSLSKQVYGSTALYSEN